MEHRWMLKHQGIPGLHLQWRRRSWINVWGQSPRQVRLLALKVLFQSETETGPDAGVTSTEDDDVEEVIRQPTQEVSVQHVRIMRWVGDAYHVYEEIHSDDVHPVVENHLRGLWTLIRVSIFSVTT